jgi:hypothetical protein
VSSVHAVAMLRNCLSFSFDDDDDDDDEEDDSDGELFSLYFSTTIVSF